MDSDFLNQIVCYPNDDQLRLTYADYLEELGQCARAEWVRLLLEWETLPQPRCAYSEHHYGGGYIPGCPGCEIRKRVERLGALGTPRQAITIAQRPIIKVSAEGDCTRYYLRLKGQSTLWHDKAGIDYDKDVVLHLLNLDWPWVDFTIPGRGN